jgi:hypothetical protein
MGGEPYAEWIKRDGNAQRLYQAYRDKWPDGTTECVAIGDEFYIRHDGDGMRRVYDVGDESEWCAQCGTPIDSDYYDCDAYGCGAVLCERCGDSVTCDHYCPAHSGNELLTDAHEPEYTHPYASGDGNQFTFGVEIESNLSDDFVENVTDSDIIAGWGKDASLERNGIELQSNILDTRLAADRGGHPRVGRERGGSYPRGAHAQSVCEPVEYSRGVWMYWRV